MHTLDSAAARILAPLSTLLQRPLELTDSRATTSFAIRLSTRRLSIIARDDKPFTDIERQLIGEVFDVVRMAEESEARYDELEQRMLSIQRENLDLVVRNRVLSEVSSRDSLTGLYNRWYVLEKLESEINRSLRHGSPMSVLMLDIDHFKRINDTYGHAAGDQVLQAVGKLLRDSCRVYDVPGRYGGEEFCILLPETRPGNTSTVAERIRGRLEATTLQCGDGNAIVTASIGVAGLESPDSVVTPSALIERADRALYSAKNLGRNRVELWAETLSGDFEGEVSH
jgi:diguanylate cyclase (GGDEF)-like protein